MFGGTFDPIHVGHLVTAVNVRHALALDRVLLVVAGDPWQKAGGAVSPAADAIPGLRRATPAPEWGAREYGPTPGRGWANGFASGLATIGA